MRTFQDREQQKAGKFNARAQRWDRKPEIPFCKYQRWHMKAKTYSGQLQCLMLSKIAEGPIYINPNGCVCDRCLENGIEAMQDEYFAHEKSILAQCPECGKSDAKQPEGGK